MSEPLDRDVFTAWLRSLPPDTEVGVPGLQGFCPCARYLQAHGYPGAQMGALEWFADQVGFFRHPSPRWAAAFVAEIDAGVAAVTAAVTAAECLAVLETVPR